MHILCNIISTTILLLLHSWKRSVLDLGIYNVGKEKVTRHTIFRIQDCNCIWRCIGRCTSEWYWWQVCLFWIFWYIDKKASRAWTQPHTRIKNLDCLGFIPSPSSSGAVGADCTHVLLQDVCISWARIDWSAEFNNLIFQKWPRATNFPRTDISGTLLLKVRPPVGLNSTI